MQGGDTFVFREDVMKQNHQTSFGRQISAVPINPRAPRDDAGLVDKWTLLTALTEAAGDFDLNHRTLSVLRALISFHPDRMIAPRPQSCIVFPANRTLSARLGGMPESTLRRHLAALVAAGIVSRHDSANRKRFARGRAGDGRVAFGFDLSALARMAPRIAAHAEAAQRRRAHLQTLRAELAALRQQMLDQHGPNDHTAHTYKLLRRKPDANALGAAITLLTNLLHTPKSSATDTRNERHIQAESKIFTEEQTTTQKDTPSFDVIVSQCTEYQSYFPDPARNWQDLSRVAYAMAPMMGIEQPVYAQAIQTMGAKRAIIAVLCTLQSLERIKNPGGYFRRLIQQEAEGRLDMGFLLRSTKPKHTAALSADNVQYHCKSSR